MNNKRKTVLIIDDEEQFRGFLQDVLKERGYRVLAAAGVEQGIKAMAETVVDLVITDMMMPDIRGSELVAHLRNNGSKVKILAMTGHPAGDAALAAAEAFSVDGVLFKPFSAKDIVAMVHGLLMHRKNETVPAEHTVA